jgi:TonB family protein
MRAAPLPILLALSIAFALPATPLAAQDAAPSVDAAIAPAPDPTITPLRRIGGGVTQPILVFKVDPQFSEQARKEKFNGVVLINFIVDTNGLPRNVHVLRGVGMGLDESAVEAVKQYRFRPAREDGRPVPVELNVEVNFQVFYDPPKILHSVPLELTDTAIQNHASGTILVAFLVDTNGNAQNVHVLRGAGMGMDERAFEAIRQYKFEPYLKDGQPIAQQTTLELKFDAASANP